jgi:hypothetical protein
MLIISLLLFHSHLWFHFSHYESSTLRPGAILTGSQARTVEKKLTIFIYLYIAI